MPPISQLQAQKTITSKYSVIHRIFNTNLKYSGFSGTILNSRF